MPQVNEGAGGLGEEGGGAPHKFVAKLLFAAKRARPDIQMGIAPPCAQVGGPGVGDQEGLVGVLP